MTARKQQGFGGMASVVSVALLAVLVLAGCGMGLVVGSGKSITETRAVSNFDRVELAFVGELDITQGDTEQLTITTDDNVMPLITTDVEDGVLVIGSKSTVGVPTTRPPHFELTVKDLHSLDLTGAGSAIVNALKTDALALHLSGAGSVNLKDLAADSLTASLSGTGSIEAAGKVDKLTAVLTGMGNFDGQALQSGAAKVTLSGVGSADVWAEETLDATISGAGGITYFGNPEVTSTISGLGGVTQGGDK